MAKFISIPTSAVGQPTIVFNTDNIATAIPPPTTVYTSAAGATSSSTTVTVTSTTGLVVGMSLAITAGVGAFAAGTTVVSIGGSTTFVVSIAPTTALSGGATVVTGIAGFTTLVSQGKSFRLVFGGSTTTIQNTNAIAGTNIINNSIVSGSPGPIVSIPNFNAITLTSGSSSGTTITVASTSGLVVGMVVSVISGTGVFAINTTVSSINSNGTQFVVSTAPTTALVAANISAAVLVVNDIAVG